MYDRYASTIKGFAPKFDERSADRWKAAFGRYLRGWLPTSPEARIGDLGCGDGKMLYLLRQSGYHNATGVDLSAEQVALARQTGGTVVCGDVREFLAGRRDEFDLLIALDLLEHLTKDEAFDLLEAVSGALRPGGRLILNTPNAASPLAGSRRYGDVTHEIAFSPSCLAGVLRLFRFDSIEARELGPYPHGVVSACRWGLWKLLRLAVMLFNYVEIGHAGDRVFTRDFLISGVKHSTPNHRDT